MKIKIGNINFNSKMILAPIAGYSDSPFRIICLKNGAGGVVTELISSEGIIRNNQKTMDFLRFTPEERPIGVQIFGNSPEIMGRAAEIVEDYKPDFIDLNMGCPSKKVCKNGAGSGAALLLHPEKINAIAENVVKRVKIPVTAKIRTGWDDNNKNYIDNVKALQDGGVDIIFVHGRTKKDGYNGKADWDIIKEIKEFASVPIVGNGDILSHEDAIYRYSFTDYVMIGRGAIGNPWIFSGKIPDKNEIIDQIKNHLLLMLDFYGERGLILMRKHIVKYIHSIHGASKFRSRLVIAKSEAEIFDILEDFRNSEIKEEIV